MRVLACVVVLLGCKSTRHRLDHLQIPEVTLADTVVAPTGPVPPLVMIDANDVPSLAVADGSWQSLAAADPKPVVVLDSGATQYVGYHVIGASVWSHRGDTEVVDIVKLEVSSTPPGPEPYIPDDGRQYYGHGPNLVVVGREMPPRSPGSRWSAEITGAVRPALPDRLPALVLAHPHASAEAVIHAVVLTGASSVSTARVQ